MTGDSYLFLGKAVRGSSSVRKKDVESPWMCYLYHPKAHYHLCMIIYFKIIILYMSPYFSSIFDLLHLECLQQYIGT